MSETLSNKDGLFFDLAIRTALESVYNGTSVGAVMAKNGHIVSVGCNGYPRGAKDNAINSLPRDQRLLLAVHAEENMLLNAARNGVSADGCRVYVTHHPCISCMTKMHNAGVTEVYAIRNEKLEKTWVEPVKNLYGFIELSKKLKVFECVHVAEAGSLLVEDFAGEKSK